MYYQNYVNFVMILMHFSMPIPYSGNFLRTINFALFVDFTATSKINP